MDATFSDMRKEVGYYMEDLTPHGKTIKQHNNRLRKVLDRLRAINMKVKISKCKFLYTKITLLGFVVNSQRISPDPSKVESVVKMPKPDTVKKMPSFLGMVNFYRRFVPRLAYIAKPLYEMTKLGKQSLWWNKEQIKAFEELICFVTSPNTWAL